MNWFAEFYQRLLLSGDPGISLPDISGMVWLLSAGLLLLWFRKFSWKLAIASVVLSMILGEIRPDPREMTQGFDWLPSVFHNLTYEAAIVLLAWVLSMALLGMNVARSKRTVDRLMIAIATFAVSSLLYGYHLMVINGDLMLTIKTEEQFLIHASIWTGDINQTLCQTPGYDCLSGKKGDPIHYPESSEISRQLMDYLVVHRQQTTGPIMYSVGGGPSALNHPFAAVVREDDSGYRAIISREKPVVWMNSAKAVFGTIALVAQTFWVLFAVAVIAFHHRMFSARKKSRSRARPSPKIEPFDDPF